LAAIAQPVIHHRGPDFRKLYSDCLGRLREVFRTESEVLLFGGSGTGAMESAVANLCSPGEPVLVVSAGYFGERWAGLANAYGAQKALMTPPGLAMVSASHAAWERSASATSPRFYWDWERTRKGQATLDAPVTPPVSLVAGLDVALRMLLDEGLESVFDRHIRLGRPCRQGL